MLITAEAYRPVLRPCLQSRNQRHVSSRLGAEGGKPNPIVAVVDDVLTYLTNMGGYTGFTEADLKGDGSSNAPVELDSETDLENWGKPKKVTSEATTTAFVVLLITFPAVLGILFIQVYGAPALFTFATQ